MVPKPLPQEAKQAKVLEWFRQSLVAHSFKDLEKSIPAVASINKMHVKDFIQALTDEGQVRVEKIGGGNWYWSFVSDTKKLKEKILHDLAAEELKLKASIADIDNQIDEATVAREDDNDVEMLEDSRMDRKALMDVHASLLKEIEILATELSDYSDNDPTEIIRKVEETQRLKESAEKWTDYIEGVEGLLKNMIGDRASVIRLMENICGDEYVAGEGLRDL